MQVKNSSRRGEFGGPGRGEAFAAGVFQAANLIATLPVLRTMNLYSTIWPSLPVCSAEV